MTHIVYAKVEGELAAFEVADLSIADAIALVMKETNSPRAFAVIQGDKNEN